ncbi:hypothetical protein ACLMJK_001248 [Lecanora helva]
MSSNEESKLAHPLQPIKSQNGYLHGSTMPLEDGKLSSEDEGSDSLQRDPQKRRLSVFKSKTTAKTKQMLRIDGPIDSNEPEHGDEDGVLDKIDHDAAFHTGALVKKKRFRPGKTADKTLNNIKSLGKAVVHPVDSIKSKATRTTAGQLSKAERPFLSKEADKEFLEAHDNLKRIESSSSSRLDISDEEQDAVIGDHRDRVRELEAHRESLRAGWTTSRHVRRVRVVPKQHINFPTQDYFMEKNQSGKSEGYDWLLWLGYNLLYYTQDFCAQYIDDFDELPFDVDSTRHHFERLLLASAPWQSWLVDVRAVYRWENPRTTSKWLAIYLVLWYTQHMMGFLYAYVIYIVVKNRYFPTHVSSIRDSLQKATDSRQRATRFGELIDRHGRNDWLEPLVDNLGPQAQLQIGDLANMLEVFSNFYHWKAPRKTAATLTFFISCLLMSLCADMAFCMKIVWFIVGGTFFLCWPIASLYPKYRYLVSPFKWVLWDIPTYAEWSFQYLRRQAQVTREQMIKDKVEKGHYHERANPAVEAYTGRMITVPKIAIQAGGDDSVQDHTYNSDEEEGEDDDDGYFSASSTTSVLEASDIRSFRAQYQGSTGRLIVFTSGIRFVHSSLPPIRNKENIEVWRYSYLDLAEMQKLDGSTKSKLTSLSPSERLEIHCVDGKKLRLEGMRERDDAFNTIIAFSGLQWQSLQIKGDADAKD